MTAQKLGKLRHTIGRYLREPAKYEKGKRRNYIKKLSSQDVRQITNSINGKSISQVKEELHLNVSKSTIWRALQKNALYHSREPDQTVKAEART